MIDDNFTRERTGGAVPASATGVPPMRAMAIAALVLAVVVPPIGLILTLIVRRNQRQLGYAPDTMTTVALGLGFAFLVIGVIIATALLVAWLTITAGGGLPAVVPVPPPG